MKIIINASNKYKTKLNSELNKIKKELTKESIYDSFNLPLQNITELNKLITEKKKLKPEKIIVIGIGGSNLGTKAIVDALNNDKIIFVDTVDTDKTKKILDNLPKKVLINIISKSGQTTETIALAELFIQKIKHQKNYYKNIVVTTDEGSNLEKLSRLQGFSTLSIPKNVGGRYSVFSNVGLFPLAMAGININSLLKGARIARTECLKNWNKVMQSAALTFESKKNILDFFFFDTAFESLGKWNRQLIAESLGKEKNLQKKIVNNGITPTISIGSIDLHSMAQLTFAGPKDKITSLITVKANNSLKIPHWKEYDALVKNIQGRKLEEIMNAITQGVINTYESKKMPYYVINFENKTAEELGFYMQFMMFKTIYLATLMNVNPFDQGAVESYKAATRQILSKR